MYFKKALFIDEKKKLPIYNCLKCVSQSLSCLRICDSGTSKKMVK